TVVGVGTVQLTATQAGNDTYAAATPVVRSVVVKKGSQVITFPEIANQTREVVSIELKATSNSGLNITYSANNHVFISNNIAMLNSAGRVEITATQAGNENYAAATPVTRSFCITPRKPSITLLGDNSTGPLLTSSDPNGNQWYRGGTAIDGATGERYVATASGTYTTIVTIEGCASEKSDDKVVTMGTGAPPDPNNPITGVNEPLDELSLRAFPNPAEAEVVVELTGPRFVTVSFSLRDVLGRPVMQMQGTTNNSRSIDLREVPKGVYFVEAVAQGKKYVTRLLK
ncbi:MAG TPA: T9SS type A sorting domain-containing protein, partial [Cyclobacteriaceae bacterium]|nr:T9SS type A sorting domain-containing protein [Cyclobacteriaceae bacterium]